MGALYIRNTAIYDQPEMVIRPIRDDDDYVAAISINVGEDEDDVVEVALTKEDIHELMDVAFNR